MDYITIDDLRVNAAHGHYEHERQIEQEFLISLRVGIDAHAAGKSDILTDTIDYDELKKIVEEIFNGQSHYLIEALAEEIAQKVLQETIAREITISIKKTAMWQSGVPGISITRSL
jgi:dihydroneopterin aldolase